MKKSALTETLVSFYTLNDFGQRVQASNAAKNQVMTILDPVSATSFQICNGAAEWIYEWASKKYSVNITLRGYFLPADRLVIHINGIKTKLSSIANFMPPALCQVFPVDLLCQDLANLAARTEFVLKLRPRVTACLLHTAKIAQEVVLNPIADQAKQAAQDKLAKTVTPVVTSAIPSAPAPSRLTKKGVQQATSLIPDADSSTVAGKLSQVAKSNTAKGLLSHFAGFAEQQIKAVVNQGNSNNDGGALGSLLKITSSEPAKAAAAIAVRQIENVLPEEEEKAPAATMAELVNQAVDATGTFITETAKQELAKNVEDVIVQLEAELAELESDYTDQARALVVDNTVKLALAYAISTGAGWFIVPNVAQQFFNLFLPASVADLAASAVSWGSLVCTGIAYFNNVNAYRADRQANQNRFAIAGNVEAVVTEGVQTEIEKLLPTAIAQKSTFFEQVRSRCLAELPKVFKDSGGPKI